MEDKRAFGVSFVGFCDRERRVLRSVSALSTARAWRYDFHEPNGGPLHLYLIDGDEPEAVGAWRALHATAPAPSAFVTADSRPELGGWRLNRPIMPSRLLALLDQMAMEELRVLPNLHIGENCDAPAAPAALKAEPADSARRALVVDDSPTVRKQIELGLRLLHVAVDFAETGEQALASVAANSYDIVFLDVVLPGIDGYQVCRAIKKDKQRRRTPVVMLTGKSSTFDRVKGSLAGCDTYLTKPVENAVFQNVLAKYLNLGERRQAPADHAAAAARPR